MQWPWLRFQLSSRSAAGRESGHWSQNSVVTLFIMVKQCSGHVWGFRSPGFKIMVIGHKTALCWHTESCLAFLLHVNACASWCMVSKCVELVILPSGRLSSQLQGCLSSVLALAGALTTMDCPVCKQFCNKEYWKDSQRTFWSTVTGAFSCCKRCMRSVLMETALQLSATRNLEAYG